jgi:hypothetical protein
MERAWHGAVPAREGRVAKSREVRGWIPSLLGPKRPLGLEERKTRGLEVESKKGLKVGSRQGPEAESRKGVEGALGYPAEIIRRGER